MRFAITKEVLTDYAARLRIENGHKYHVRSLRE
jgi:hypothetical protein